MSFTNTVSAITKAYFAPVMIDNIHTNNAVYSRLKEKNQVIIDGGERIQIPIRYQKPLASGWYANGSSTLNVTDLDACQAAEFTWKHLYGGIIVDGTDEAKNQGKEQVINYVKEKMEGVKKAMEDQLAIAVFNDGTSNADAPQGLRLAGNITGTYGAIAKGSATYWQGNLDSATTTLTLAVLNGLLSDTDKVGAKTTVMYTTHDILDILNNLFQPQERYMDPKTANAGFQNILIKGVPVIADSHCPAGYLFGLDEEYFKYYVNKNRNLEIGDFVEPVNQDLKVAKVLTMCALTYSKPASLFTLSAIAR